MASRRSAASSGECKSSKSKVDNLLSITLNPDEAKLSSVSEGGKPSELSLAFNSVPVNILTGNYENARVRVLAKQLMYLTPKEYGKFSRFVFDRLARYFTAIVYVSNRVSELNPKEYIKKTIQSTTNTGNVRNKDVTLFKSDNSFMKNSYVVALKRAGVLLRSVRKSIRTNVNQLSNVSQPMFACNTVVELFAQFPDDFFGGQANANSLPLAREGKMLKLTIMSILFAAALRVKLSLIDDIQIKHKAAQLRKEIQSWSNEEIDKYESELLPAKSGFSPEVANFLRKRPALYNYANERNKLVKVKNTSKDNLEVVMQEAAAITAEIKGEPLNEFDLEAFSSFTVTRMLHNICVLQAPQKTEFGSAFTDAQYREAAEFFDIIEGPDNAERKRLIDDLFAEKDAVREIAASLNAEREEFRRQVNPLLAVIRSTNEKRCRPKKDRTSS